MQVITIKRLGINKGSEVAPNYRARLVGDEIARNKRDDLYAAAPPLESLGALLLYCAGSRRERTRTGSWPSTSSGHTFMFRQRIPCSSLSQRKTGGDGRMVAKLNFSLHRGTRP